MFNLSPNQYLNLKKNIKFLKVEMTFIFAAVIAPDQRWQFDLTHI